MGGPPVDISAGVNTFANLPPHKDRQGRPAGGSAVYADGSARWVKYETMYAFHTWRTDRLLFWYQDSSDFEQNLISALNTLSARNF